MKSRFVAVALGACALLSLLAPGAAASGLATPVQIDRSGTIVGVETTVGSVHADTVRLKLLSPRAADGTRVVRDRCVLPYAGPGHYRCEFDVSAATARERRGEWKARLRLDDYVVERRVFRLS